MKKVDAYLKKFGSTIPYQIIENMMKILSFSQYEEQFERYELLGFGLKYA